MSFCPATIAFNKEGETSLIYCGKWSCPNCAKTNAGRWAKRVELGINSWVEEGEGDAWLLTLTLGSSYTDTTSGYRAIPTLWDGTRKSFQRWYGKFTYVAFVEGQPNRGGMPHFHIVTQCEPPVRRGRRGYVTKHGVHDFAVSHGWGYEAELSLVMSGEAAVYVAKYTSKGDPSMPRNFRRVRVSRDFPKLPDLEGSPLLVPSRTEDVAHFIARVADYTGLSAESIYARYADIEKTMYNERNNR